MRNKTLPLILAAAGMVLLAACSGTTAEQSAPVAADGAVAEVAPGVGAPQGIAPDQGGAGTVATTTTNTSSDRQVVKNAYVSMEVDDVAKSVFAIHGLVKKRNGLIASEETQASGDATSSMITAQIPAADLDAFITDVSALGTVQSVNISAQDVTGQVVDLDARIKALQTSVDRMTQLLAQAQKIDDMLAIETQLSARQAELDSLTAQRKVLGEQVALSTATITLSPKTEIKPVEAPGFLSGLQSGWAAFVSVITVMVTAAGFLLPFALVAAIFIGAIVFLVLRANRRHRNAKPAEVDAERATD